MQVPGPTKYKRKTLLRRRAYKLVRNAKDASGTDKPRAKPGEPENRALDQLSLR
jgi:hypothetical protein